MRLKTERDRRERKNVFGPRNKEGASLERGERPAFSLGSVSAFFCVEEMAGNDAEAAYEGKYTGGSS